MAHRHQNGLVLLHGARIPALSRPIFSPKKETGSDVLDAGRVKTQEAETHTIHCPQTADESLDATMGLESLEDDLIEFGTPACSHPATCDAGNPNEGLEAIQHGGDRPAAGQERMHLVFGDFHIARCKARLESCPREEKKMLEAYLKLMCRFDGKRQILPLPQRLDDLRGRFPNFRGVLDCIEAHAALESQSGRASESIDPILIVGEPGIGKTLFVEALAGTLGLPLTHIPMGSLQGGFEFCGTAQHWSNYTPGRIWRVLAESDYGNPMLLLDEIDKASVDLRDPIYPVLLDLLESRTAKTFGDQALDITFDASFLFKLATANELNPIPQPIKSRMNVFEIPRPSCDELRSIYASIWEEIVAKLAICPTICDDVLDVMASTRMTPREARRRLRLSVGLALRDGQCDISILYGSQPVTRKRIGF